MKNLQPNISSPALNKSNFVINASDKSASITYDRLGQEYLLNVPFDRSYVAKMAHFEVQLIKKDDKISIITQQPGVPYMITAQSLGGQTIKIINHDNDKTAVYSDDVMPLYGHEVFDEE